MVSRQREWQKRNKAKGLCQLCTDKAVTKMHCEEHRLKFNERRLERYHAKKNQPKKNLL